MACEIVCCIRAQRLSSPIQATEQAFEKWARFARRERPDQLKRYAEAINSQWAVAQKFSSSDLEEAGELPPILLDPLLARHAGPTLRLGRCGYKRRVPDALTQRLKTQTLAEPLAVAPPCRLPEQQKGPVPGPF